MAQNDMTPVGNLNCLSTPLICVEPSSPMAQNDMTPVGNLNCLSTPLICVEPYFLRIAFFIEGRSQDSSSQLSFLF
jgi:hypothetical protein